jgi:hypothetical protein
VANLFLSYALKDRDFARALSRELSKYNVRGFLDEQDLSADGDITRQLRDALEATSAVVVILSEAAVNSSYVLFEIGAAQALDKPIIPILAPKSSYDESVPEKLMSELIIDANHCPIDEVAARVISTVMSVPLDEALGRVRSRAKRRTYATISLIIVLGALSILSLYYASRANKERVIAIVAANEAIEAKAEAERQAQLLIRFAGGNSAFAISHDGNLLASSDEHRVRIWSVATGRVLSTIEVGKEPITGLAISPSAEYLAVATADGQVRIFMISGIGDPIVLSTTDLTVGVLFSPDGKSLFTRSIDGTLTEWSTTTLTQVEVYGPEFRGRLGAAP